MADPIIAAPVAEAPKVEVKAEVKPSEVIAPEVKVEPVKPPDPPKPEIIPSSRFATLAKAEQNLQRKRTELKAEQAALNTQRQEMKALQEVQELAKTDPVEAMKRLGIDYDAVTKKLLADPISPEQQAINRVQRELESLKSQRVKDAEEQKAANEAAKADAIQKFHADVEATIRADADTYELINMTESFDLVTQVIQTAWDEGGYKTNKVMTTNEAATKVEEYLEQQQMDRVTKSKKIQARLTKEKAALAKKVDQPPAKKQPGLTISNAMAPASKEQIKSKEYYSETEVIRRAIAAGRKSRGLE